MDNREDYASVPYYVVESLIAVHKRQTIQLAIINLITVAVLIFGFAYIWTSYDYASTETTTVQQDGSCCFTVSVEYVSGVVNDPATTPTPTINVIDGSLSISRTA